MGAASRDLTTEDPRGWRLGGGVCYSALTTARLGLRTAALVGVDEDASRAAELDLLRQAGVDVHLVPLGRGPVFENIETPEGRIQLCFERSDPVRVDDLPAPWGTARGWILAAVADELPDSWAQAAPAEALLAVGWQGLLRDLAPGSAVHRRRPSASPLIRRADIVAASRDDLEHDIQLHSLCALLRPGSTLVVTGGSSGGMAMTASPEGPLELRRYPAIPSPSTVDPTGAGDVFLASLLAARVEPRLVGGRIGHGLDLRLAAAVASLVLEGPGLLGVPDRAAVRRRLQFATPKGVVPADG